MLGEIGSGLAVILTYYGVLFLLGLPFLGPARARPADARRGLGGGRAAAQHRDPGPPAHPRHRQSRVRPARRARPAALRAAVHRLLPGAAVAGVPPRRPGARPARPARPADPGGDRRPRRSRGGGRDVAVARPHRPAARRGRPARRHRRERESVDELLREIQYGMFGTTPRDGSWAWMLVVAPHSSTPFDLAQTIGSACLVLGTCLLVVGALRGFWLRFVQVLFGAGAMTLTLYTLHVVMRTPDVYPTETPDSYVWHVLIVLGIGAAYAAMRRKGPLEQLIGHRRGCGDPSRARADVSPAGPARVATWSRPGGVWPPAGAPGPAATAWSGAAAAAAARAPPAPAPPGAPGRRPGCGAASGARWPPRAAGCRPAGCRAPARPDGAASR